MKFFSAPPFLLTLAGLASAQRLRRGESTGSGSIQVNDEKAEKLDEIIRQLSASKKKIDHNDIPKDGLKEGLSKSFGFGLPIFPTVDDNDENVHPFGGENIFSSSSSGNTFTQCPNELPCDTVIATYTRTEVKTILDGILSATINVDGCLDQYSEYYGQCNVDYPCVCPTFENPLACILGICFATVCPSDCYANSLGPLIDSLVQHGVEVRKICASCDEEINIHGNVAIDTIGVGYCDGSAYGKNATVSGLLVLPLDATGQTYLSGAMTSNIWSHPTTVQTCSIPSQYDVDPVNAQGDLNALIPLLLGAAGSASLAPDNLGFGSSWDYFKGYIIKKQYQTSAMPLWLKARRLVVEATGCGSEISNEVVVSGYSEGGYGATAIAEALESYGANIIRLQAGAGPYKISSALLTQSYNDIVNGVFPSGRRYYMPQLAQGYSSSYEGLENYGVGQDLLAESWNVDNSGIISTYTKHDAIEVTTNLGSESSLNAMVQTPMSITSLAVWNPNFVEFVGNAVAEGEADPCKNVTRITEFTVASKPVDKICEAFVANDLTEYLNSITSSSSYAIELCHSLDDDVIPIEVAQNEVFSSELYLVSGDHNFAGQLCIERAVKFFDNAAYKSVVPERTGIYCPKPTTSPTNSPTKNPTASPSKIPTSSPSRSPTKSPAKTGVCSNDAQMTCISDEQCCGPPAASSNMFNRRLKGTQQATGGNISSESTERKLAKKTSSPVTQSPTSPPTEQPTNSPIQCACLPVPEDTPSPTSSPASCGAKSAVCTDNTDCCNDLTCQQKGPSKKCS